MANWFQKLTRRLQRPSVADQRGAPGTPPQQWTVTGIRFDTAGWTLVDATPARMSWSSPNGTLVLSREEDQQQAETIGLTALRDQRRADARADAADLVTLDMVAAPRGEVLQTIWKRRSGLGHAYRGLIEFSTGPHTVRIEIDADEGNQTGTREGW